MNKTALITGISGQDGAYLSQLLLSQGYEVFGVIRVENQLTLYGLHYLEIDKQVQLVKCNLLELKEVMNLLEKVRPTEVYNLVAQSSVFKSFQEPIETFNFNTISVFNLLEGIRQVNRKIKFYQASSSEMFGKIKKLPITEDTEFHPLSPYAISKAAAHWICVNYRESYNMFICCGILFNHESVLRKQSFFIKKVICEALQIKAGQREIMEVGNLDIKRDFGYAPEYVKAMYLMMQQGTSRNYLISSGKSVSLRYIVEYVFNKLGISFDKYRVSKELYRPADIEDIYGNSDKVSQYLNWSYNYSIEWLLDKLIEEEMAKL